MKTESPDILTPRDLTIIGLIVGVCFGFLLALLPGYTRALGIGILAVSVCSLGVLAYKSWKDYKWKPSE